MLCGDKKITCAASHFIFYHFVRCNALLDALWWRWWLFCISTSVFVLSFFISFAWQLRARRFLSVSIAIVVVVVFIIYIIIIVSSIFRLSCIHSDRLLILWGISRIGNFHKLIVNLSLLLNAVGSLNETERLLNFAEKKILNKKKENKDEKKIRPEEMAIQTYSFICLLLVDDHRIAPAISPTITFDVTSIKKTSTRKKMRTPTCRFLFLCYINVACM